MAARRAPLHDPRAVTFPFQRASAEFPNDNPELHGGAVWRCRATLGPPRAIVRPSAPPAPPAIEMVLAVEAPPAVDVAPAVDAAPAVEAAPADLHAEDGSAGGAPAEPDAFRQLCDVLSKVALAAGATRAAAVLPELMEHGRVPLELTSEGLVRAACGSGLAVATGHALELTPAASATTSAWRAILSGQSGDLSACGDTTLDGWCAELLAAVMTDGARASDWRAKLRAHGVAAFGLVTLAA